MHSRIYVIEEKMTADKFLMDFPWFVGSIADYVGDTASEELENVPEMKGVSINSEECTITLSDGDSYFRNIVDACKFASYDIPDDGVSATQIWKNVMSSVKNRLDILNDKFGIYVVYDDMLLTLNEFLAYYARKGVAYKAANVLDYHY